MKACDVMEEDVKTCRPADTPEAVVMAMWNNDGGAVPVIVNSGTPIGIVTDRDIAICCALSHKPLWDLHVKDVTNNRPVHTCNENNDIATALRTMPAHRIRRLPVADDGGHLKGIISAGDIVALSEENVPGLSFQDTMNMLKAVCVHH